jgi:hypothetical protein
MTNIRVASYYLVTYVRWFLILLIASLFIGTLVAGLLGQGEDFSGKISLVILLFISPLFMYIKAQGERHFTKEFWSPPAFGRPAKYFMIGHLGFAYCIVALAAMTIGKSGSGIALLPGIFWISFFYSKGFKFLRALTDESPNNSFKADSQPLRGRERP